MGSKIDGIGQRKEKNSEGAFRNRLYRSLVLLFLIFIISASYLFLSIARGPQQDLESYPERYALLARSFLAGTTSLPVRPSREMLSLRNPYDPELNSRYRLQDASLYNGRYYLYFGATPVVTLFLPYRVLTGKDLTNRVAIPVYCILGFWSSCILFLLLARRNRWVLPLWLDCAITVSLGSASLVYLVFRRPSFYEVPIAAGYFFIMTGFLVLAWVGLSPRASFGLLFLDGILFGAAVGCRPHLVVISGIVLLAFAIRSRHDFKPVVAMAAGLACCGLALSWYNYVRFDSPIEFGRRYQVTAFSNDPSVSYGGVELNLGTSLVSAQEMLFVLPHIDGHIPFFHMVAINPLPSHPGRAIWTEEMVGAVPASPFLLAGCAAPFFLRKGFARRLLDHTSIWVLDVMYRSGVAILLILCVVGWILVRYLLDFAPILSFEGLIVTVMVWLSLPEGRKRAFVALIMGAVITYCAAVNLAFATPSFAAILKFLES